MGELALTDVERVRIAEQMALSPWYVGLMQIDAATPDGLAYSVGYRKSKGETQHRIALHLGCRKGHLRMWINADPARVAAHEAGLCDGVEETVFEAAGKNAEIVEIADNLEDDDSRANRRIGGRNDFIKNTLNLAGKLDQKRWGNKSTKDVNVHITGGDWGERLRRAKGRTYDGEATVERDVTPQESVVPAKPVEQTAPELVYL